MLGESLAACPILVVDDEVANVVLLDMLLRGGGFLEITGTTDPARAMDLIRRERYCLILLDLHMPHPDGFEILEYVRTRDFGGAAPMTIMLTADITFEAKRRALGLGARDFLTKPFDNVEVLLRVNNLLELHRLQERLAEQNHTLEERVLARTLQLNETRLEIVKRLARAAEYRDDDTGQHIMRVGSLSARIADSMGMENEFCQTLLEAAPLHDVGKIGIPDEILLKPGKLTPDEWDVMKRHTEIGAAILAGSPHALLNLAEEIALSHHERYDGKGYHGIIGDAIPASGRIVSVADVYDALTNNRPYKKAWSHEDAVIEITSQRGRQFDPAVIDAFARVV